MLLQEKQLSDFSHATVNFPDLLTGQGLIALLLLSLLSQNDATKI